MNEWELTDEDLEREASFGAMEYCDRIPREGQFIDEEIVAGQRAVATAAQKKLVEWWLDNFNVSALTPELAEKWKAFLAALGVKDED
jgi:hypothetical protein